MSSAIKKLQRLCIILFIFTATACAEEYKCIISLAPSITESLYELGLEQSIKGITIYCPKGAIKKEIIGALLEPDIEKIILLNPDLIIATKEGNSKAIVEKLKRLKFDVYVVESPENFNEICENYYRLAEKLDRTKEAIKIINTANDSLQEIYDRLKNFDKLKLFWEIGIKPLYTAGNKSFVNDYNYYSKTINVYKNINARYLSVDIEDVIERNPDIILLVNTGYFNSQEPKNWKKYKTINAVKNNKVFMINSNNIFATTPLTFANGVKIITQAIYGDIFNDK
ncbi:MAG: helical backbone metal receptor [Endomicrobium sp.]|uniref:ABC transporter substrate-binding protein n=1 Tax=Candidatus Endomicrobiellum pyrsonymphae TaxID=1408203 RepID=UPI00357B6C77|nr:helical backbone metal receptor [Endomicrobium sp.]